MISDGIQILENNWKRYGLAVSIRMVRILPAFGLGGVVNTSVRSALADALVFGGLAVFHLGTE